MGRKGRKQDWVEREDPTIQLVASAGTIGSSVAEMVQQNCSTLSPKGQVFIHPLRSVKGKVGFLQLEQSLKGLTAALRLQGAQLAGSSLKGSLCSSAPCLPKARSI